MLFSLATILLIGMGSGYVCKQLKLPGLVGMILTGILIGPEILNIIDPKMLDISAELRKIALIIIMIRAGLSLDINDLRKVGRPAFLMCFIPACFEIIGMLILAPKLLGVSLLEAAIIGAVVGAVSPAVIVPKMLKLMEENMGTDKSIPQLILAGASVDDVFVIVLFTSFVGMATGGTLSVIDFINIPISIVLGIGLGLIIGYLMVQYFKKVHLRDTIKVIILLCIAFILVSLEDASMLPYSALISIMFVGIAIQRKNNPLSNRLSLKFNKLWIVSEIVLFVLVGACVKISVIKDTGFYAVLLILGVLLFRMIGVLLCLVGTNLTRKERLFCVIAYLPKATVQAAIGGIPLSLGLAVGNTVLSVAVVSILLTAPLGAFLIDKTYQRLLNQ